MTKVNRAFKKMRGIDDRTLGAALTNHADVLDAIGRATTLLLRERRLGLVWALVVTGAVVWLVLR